MRVGVFLPNWIGDVVMATPAVRAVRTHLGPEAQLFGVMRPYVAEVLRGKIDAPGGWAGILERYREAAGA